MRNPNGYGGITKLSGNRRNPWRVQKTIGWELVNRKTKKVADSKTVIENPSDYYSRQKFINIGYYPTREDAMMALAAYNKDPYELNLDKITFAEVYDKWSEVHFENISQSNINGYKAAYNLCDHLKNMRMVDIKLDHLQKCVDESGKNTPTLKKLKILWGLMWDYCVMHEILPNDKRAMIKYVDITKAGNPNSYNRKPFTDEEVEEIWKYKDENIYYTVILMLIYSGCRISELLNLKKVNINLEEKWFYVTASKTQAGIRKVPISDKILPFFKYWYNKNNCEYLLSTPEGKHFQYRNYYDAYWKPLVNDLSIFHRPHDTRHTCISLLASKSIDERLIKKIVGHKGQSITETVYTHFQIDELLEAINKI